MSPTVVCLLPARNAAADLPAWFASVERFADAVVALDDGSTDDTRAALEGHPLVQRVLTNPVRPTYAGWDDADNRNRLLEAAGALEPDWIISLDADERIDADDADVLREFLEREALPQCAFGLQLFRMWGDDGYEPDPAVIFRVFAYAPGQRFPDDEPLHFNPVPTTIPQALWVPTTVRVRHVGAPDEAGRLARLAKYREADPAGCYRTDFGGLDQAPKGPLPCWDARPAGLPALLAQPPDRQVATDAPPRVVCLLPARNAAADLPAWFASVERFADAVVALDDGSTDDTRAALEWHPLVQRVLTNPVRPTYAGWDDADNRNRLLEAAGALEPDWIISLDADERIDVDDADALRDFIAQEALPGLAYGFRVHRMHEDLRSYHSANLWVYRLFAWKPGQRFPDQRLHFVPVPTSVPRHCWVRTTVRIQHLAGMTPQRRTARFEKYRQADPDHVYQADYRNLLAEPEQLLTWTRRPPGLAVMGLQGEEDGLAADEEDTALDLDAPVLSAVIISRDDEDRIERCVRSVVGQQCPEPFEVIVVTSGSDRTAEIVRACFPEVTLIELDHPALPGEARNAGLRAARGDYVSFPGSHVELPPGSLAARMGAHELGYPMVTGTTLNGNETPAGWASYFLDHSSVLPGRPSEELRGPPAHCSYAREFLLRVGGFPEDRRAGEDTVVNTLLWQSGYTAYRAQDVPLIHRSPCRTPGRLVSHHFERGRALGRLLRERDGSGRRLPTRATLAALARYPYGRLTRTSANVTRWGGDLRAVYRRVWPLVALGVIAAWAGTCYQVARGLPGAPPEAADAAGHPAGTAHLSPPPMPDRVAAA